MIEVGTRMVTILRRLHFVSSKSVQNYGRNHRRQLEKRGFEINAFKVLCLYEVNKEVMSLKRLFLLKYFKYPSYKNMQKKSKKNCLPTSKTPLSEIRSPKPVF